MVNNSTSLGSIPQDVRKRIAPIVTAVALASPSVKIPAYANPPIARGGSNVPQVQRVKDMSVAPSNTTVNVKPSQVFMNGTDIKNTTNSRKTLVETGLKARERLNETRSELAKIGSGVDLDKLFPVTD